ncbi:MAG TPA: universal stress protein [Phycisphaerae bacterium]|nr:universal stress protein [Phycisphaerae bacterium]HRW51436.1 universal stress protein [Phycisphaerae bacterium]
MSRPVVLYATDFSAASELALTHARIYARAAGARLLITHVMKPSGDPTDLPSEGAAESVDIETVRFRLESIAKSITDTPTECRILSGDPAREVLKLAETAQAELIVMGTHGRTGLSRLLMGSVAEQVVREADCPVLTVKLPRADDPS